MVKAPNTPSTLEFEAPRAGGQCGRTMFCVAQKRPRGYPLPGNPSENLERETGFEPATLSLGTDFTRSPPGVSGSQALVTTGGGYDTGVQPSQPEQMLLKGFATPLLRNSGSGVTSAGPLLTVREVARVLRVSRATASVRARYKSQVRQATRAKQAKHDLAWDEMVDNGYVVIGSPDTVREKLEEACKELRIGHLCAMLQFGNMSDELTRYNTRLFADKVAPGLRTIFAEYPDPWWPENAR